MDLKIELRKLFALHEACRLLDHGVRETRASQLEWRRFAPSRFVYAFFTFDSIYSYDWASSFREAKALAWPPDDKNRLPSEGEQIREFVRYLTDELGERSGDIFRHGFSESLLAFGVSNPGGELRSIDLVNADKSLRNSAKQMPTYVEKLEKGRVAPSDMYSTLSHVLRFVYLVRCNLFHGVKTYVEMADSRQQHRFLIYAALLVATNGLLFQVPALANIGWREVSVDFADPGALPGAAAR